MSGIVKSGITSALGIFGVMRSQSPSPIACSASIHSPCKFGLPKTALFAFFCLSLSALLLESLPCFAARLGETFSHPSRLPSSSHSSFCSFHHLATSSVSVTYVYAMHSAYFTVCTSYCSHSKATYLSQNLCNVVHPPTQTPVRAQSIRCNNRNSQADAEDFSVGVC